MRDAKFKQSLSTNRNILIKLNFDTAGQSFCNLYQKYIINRIKQMLTITNQHSSPKYINIPATKAYFLNIVTKNVRYKIFHYKKSSRKRTRCKPTSKILSIKPNMDGLNSK